ncbi:HAMP domain-containing sensor histidine kinase [Colwellia sp. M166]|uniref:sensor histidine kinase n=1 Tax=Colwellia sp. M166 TaxID=2583805 RepID=UPI00211E6B65|nr:HAMP domain-containing sensor histidine kinase [Colwellia sp. M166]|tara:strand:- start:7269 stop:8525 length:1257 start_codon:yes stop_codon:yes gene_type:complete
MPVINYQNMTIIQRLFLLRTVAIIIQLLTVLIVYFVMSLQIALLPLMVVIIVESLFHILSILIFRQRDAGNVAIVLQLIADVIFLTVLLSLSGGATNAFVSLLLLPIVIAAVSLPASYLLFISFSAIASYSALLLTMPEHTMHHMDMSNHFIGMWANFLLSVIVVTFVVGAMARVITNRERAIALQREDQLKSEQLLALGVASAQVTHQVATPLANIQLLYEELAEDYPEHEAIIAMAQPLAACTNQLGYFRSLATSIRENKKTQLSVTELLEQLVDQMHFHFPEQALDIIQADSVHGSIISDAMLLPALLNLIQNAIRANEESQQQHITLTVSRINNTLSLQLRDFGAGIEANMSQAQREVLGEQMVVSKSGLGMAVFLSNSTFQRLGGKLKLINHSEQGCIALVTLPLLLDNKEDE